MTVAQLIALLETMPQDKTVVLRTFGPELKVVFENIGVVYPYPPEADAPGRVVVIGE